MMFRIFIENDASFACGGRKGEVEEQKKEVISSNSTTPTR
jgi:hypothetical protein